MSTHVARIDEAASLRAVIETVVDGVILIDGSGAILVFNPACERLFGYAADEVIGRNVKLLMPPPYSDEHDSYLANYGKSGERKIIGIGREVTGRRKDGSTFPMDLSVGETAAAGGSVFVGIVRDLTERVHAQVAIRESERRFRLLVEGVTDYALFMLDLDGNVANWNAGAQRIKQYEAEEIVGRHFGVFYSDDDRFAGAPAMALADARLLGKHEAEAWRVRKDGSHFWASVVIDPVRDEADNLIGYVKITRDISERKQAEAALLERAAQLRAVVDTAVDGVILIDGYGTVLMFNPACEKLFGYGAAEIIGQNVKVLMPEPYRSGHDNYIANFHTTRAPKVIGIGREVQGRRKDGSTFPMDLSVGEARQSGGDVNFVGVIHDLTGRKRTEEQLVQAQKMEVVGQLSGGIAHDFNNLLTVIIGATEGICARLTDRPELRDSAQMVLTAAERGAQLVQRLLAFSRRQVLQPAPIDCGAMIESMHVLLRRMLREDIEIRIETRPETPRALADAAQLESAILNLALNSQDAMADGGLLTLAAREVEIATPAAGAEDVHPGRYVVVSVSDQGRGMDRETLEKAYEPFFTTKEVGKGSGLGLSMVYGFAKQSNGHVLIDSALGEGTTVQIFLPVADEHGSSDTSASSLQASVEHGLELILVVEDDPLVRGHVVGLIQSLGYRVLVAGSGREALAMFERGARPDLLFTDIIMPGGVDGWELSLRARKIMPGIRVLFTSGYPMEALPSRDRMNPSEALLSKPYRLAELARRMREKLDS